MLFVSKCNSFEVFSKEEMYYMHLCAAKQEDNAV